MKLFINHEFHEKGYLKALAVIINREKKLNVRNTYVTAKTLTMADIKYAVKQGWDAFLIANEATLNKLFPVGKNTLDEYRGSTLIVEGKPVLIINALHQIHSVPYGKWILEQDLKKLYTATESTFSFKTCKTREDLAAAVSLMKKASLLSLDIETIPTRDKDKHNDPYVPITSIAYTGWFPLAPAAKQYRTIVIPLMRGWQLFWEEQGDYEYAWDCIKELNFTKIPKIMQNGMYDATHLMVHNAPPYNWLFDTMGLSWSQYQELPKSLDMVASLNCTDYVQWKHEAELSKQNNDPDLYDQYNAKDTYYTLKAFINQCKNYPDWAWHNYREQFPLVYPFLYMSFEGILVDEEERNKKLVEARSIQQKALETLQVMTADPDFNPGSWQQKEELFYGILKAKKPGIGKSKSCTDNPNLLKLKETDPFLGLFVDQITEYQDAAKSAGTYFNFPLKRGRLLYSLSPFGTETGRAACSASPLCVGTQVQNIPYYAKSFLIADPGYTMGEIDNNKSEARCTAYLAESDALIEILEDTSKDFYKQLGPLLFNIPYEDVTTFFRNKVLKKTVHGNNYMMGAVTFMHQIGTKILVEAARALGIKIVNVCTANNLNEMTLVEFAGYLLDKYHDPFPELRSSWYPMTQAQIDSKGYLESVFGFRRYFFGKSKDIIRTAVAHQPQNLSVAIINKGILRVYKEAVVKTEAKIVRLKAQVHDSALFQIKDGHVDEWFPKLQELLVTPVQVNGRTMVIPVDGALGKTWKEAKDNG